MRLSLRQQEQRRAAKSRPPSVKACESMNVVVTSGFGRRTRGEVIRQDQARGFCNPPGVEGMKAAPVLADISVEIRLRHRLRLLVP